MLRPQDIVPSIRLVVQAGELGKFSIVGTSVMHNRVYLDVGCAILIRLKSSFRSFFFCDFTLACSSGRNQIRAFSCALAIGCFSFGA